MSDGSGFTFTSKLIRVFMGSGLGLPNVKYFSRPGPKARKN